MKLCIHMYIQGMCKSMKHVRSMLDIPRQLYKITHCIKCMRENLISYVDVKSNSSGFV